MGIERANWERLKTIQDKMHNLLEEAKSIVRRADKHEYERGKAYWMTYIDNAIDGPKSPTLPCTMGDTIYSLGSEFDDELDDDEIEEDDG